ncbi:hypothetical protein AVEN_207305-1 [Araneus ventricosus]|uniref:Uncharacterized protein n=1 Tax=Araneus ventricosus TaxID=182803 RepID=A0A4Y2A8H0_ARAVE|nr:hypothetical protein AVEN_207305-1 [Araneus ventricosus]
MTPLDASSQNRRTLKGQIRSWKIFCSKKSQPTSSLGIGFSLLSHSYTPTVSFSLQIKITSGRSRQSPFSAIITASSRSSCTQCFQITDSSYARRGFLLSPLSEVLQILRSFNSSPK